MRYFVSWLKSKTCFENVHVNGTSKYVPRGPGALTLDELQKKSVIDVSENVYLYSKMHYHKNIYRPIYDMPSSMSLYPLNHWHLYYMFDSHFTILLILHTFWSTASNEKCLRKNPFTGLQCWYYKSRGTIIIYYGPIRKDFLRRLKFLIYSSPDHSLSRADVRPLSNCWSQFGCKRGTMHFHHTLLSNYVITEIIINQIHSRHKNKDPRRLSQLTWAFLGTIL